MVSITVHGGAGEIGGNKILLEDGDPRSADARSGAHRLFLDFGMSFGKMGDFFEDFLQPRTNSGLRDLLALGILPRSTGSTDEAFWSFDRLEETLAELGVRDDSLWAADVKSYKEIGTGTAGRPSTASSSRTPTWTTSSTCRCSTKKYRCSAPRQRKP